MPPYQPTDEETAYIMKLEDFHKAIEAWSKSSQPDERDRLRSFINRNVEEVREIVRLAGCRKTMTISPPPAVGGLVMQGVDPFNYIFDSVYLMSLQGQVKDMLDQTIGVIQSGKFQERKALLERAAGALGPISGSKVFLVHGHDESARETTARFLEKLDLDPVILHEQPSSGRTIIEKVEQYSEVAFAVVLLTPDDVGAKRGSEPELAPRARQNVILELGYFLGKLGRKHVAALIKDTVEKPSDFDGVVYIQMDAAGAWKLQLAREMKAAGLNVDLNKAV